jgi:hypothetical protein
MPHAGAGPNEATHLADSAFTPLRIKPKAAP